MLEPYRVLDLTDERGMLCGRILADLGADVIAVEPPGGSSARSMGPFHQDRKAPDGSLYWWAFARGKKSITLDLESEEGRDRLRDLATTADFLIESFGPGRTARLGLDYEALAAINPRLVMVSISPFGQDGPKARWAATDLTVWASSGALLITGDADRPPLYVPGGQAWLHVGAEAAVGALIAHMARERDGVGQHVDVSAQAASMMATQSFILQAGWKDNPLQRMAGGVKLGPMKVRFIYPCKDGYVSISFLFGNAIGPFSRRLMEWMCEEGFVDEATRDKDWLSYTELLLSGQEPQSELERVTAAIERFSRSKTKAELFETAQRRGLLIVPVNTTADIVQSEHLRVRGYWTPVEHDGDLEPVVYPGPFARFSAAPPA